MKKQIFKIAVLLLPVFGYSQMVVTDPTQAANMSTQIQATTQQIAQLDKSLDYMKKASDAVTKVSGYVRDVNDLSKITKMYKESISKATKIRSNLSNIKDANRRNQVGKDVSTILKNLNESITFINKILSNNFFAMSDKERMDLISAERRKVLINKSKLVTYLD